MNILDVSIDLNKYKGKDKLETLFEIQKELCKKMDPDLLSGDFYSKEGQERIKKYIFYCAEELFELSNKMKGRPWVKTTYIPDVNEIYDEISDALLMLILVALSLGIDAEKMFELSLKKIEVNKFRNNTNY